MNTHIVVVGEMRVRDSDTGGAHYSVDETILAFRHRNVVKPNVCCSKDGDTISIGHSSKPKMVIRVSYHATSALDDVMDVKPMDDDIMHVLHRDPSTICDVHVSATSIDRLVTINH